jgi:hypothetical protein
MRLLHPSEHYSFGSLQLVERKRSIVRYRTNWRLLPTLSLTSLLGCAAPTGRLWSSPADAVKVSQRDVDARLARTRELIRESEQRAEAARRVAIAVECRAEVASIDAEASEQIADCLAAQTRTAACRANVARQAADNTLLGCAGGILLGVVTGGAAAPMALLGCGLGRAASTDEAACGQTVCSSKSAVLLQVLAKHGIERLPMCGGQLGLMLEEVALHRPGPDLEAPRIASGVRVAKVLPGSPAERAKIKAGDQVVTLNGHAVVGSSPDAAFDATRNTAPGERVSITVSEADGTRRTVTVILDDRLDQHAPVL